MLYLGTDDCIIMYTGKGNDNWETMQCFQPLGYICEIPEGQALSNNVETSVYLHFFNCKLFM